MLGKKKPKVLYTMKPAEMDFLRLLARQIEISQRALDHFLGEIGARERIPAGSEFNTDTGVFREKQEPPKPA